MNCDSCGHDNDGDSDRCERCRKLIDPSPEEIRRRCLEIQATWSPREREKRLNGTLRRILAETPVWNNSSGRVDRTRIKEA